jgi:hypothetical protein
MRTFTFTSTLMLLIMCISSIDMKAQINWDFEDGEDHGFTLRCIVPADPAADDPDIAGDEELTGVGGTFGLPDAGLAWTIGVPNEFDGLIPAFEEGCHVVNGVLEYGDCNDPFGAAVGVPPFDFTNGRGQSYYLNTYNLSQWGDGLHLAANDQIATSPPVLLGAGAVITVWAFGNSTSDRTAPIPEADSDEGYTTGSGGIAILSADDGSLLDTLFIAATGGDGNMPAEFSKDLSDLEEEEVIIEVVDAFEGSWGWLAIDEIEITNANVVVPEGIENKQSFTHIFKSYPNPFDQSTTIEYTLAKSSQINITVYNLVGHKVETLMDEYRNSGTHQLVWNASELSPGVYLVVFNAEGITQTTKMNLIR